MLHFGWETLPAGGKLVASAVTAKSQRDLKDFLKDKPAREWMQIGVEKNLPNQPETRILAPVHLGKCVKPGART